MLLLLLPLFITAQDSQSSWFYCLGLNTFLLCQELICSGDKLKKTKQLSEVCEYKWHTCVILHCQIEAYTFFVFVVIDVAEQFCIGLDAVHFPALHTSTTQSSLIPTPPVLLAEQRINATFTPFCGPPGITKINMKNIRQAILF